MSQRRQESRRAKQERAREQRHQQRVAARRPPVAATQTRPATATAAAKRSSGLLSPRNRNIAIAGAVGVVVVAFAVWVFLQARAPLPGTKYESQGNQHLASPTEQHPPYNSNPPTSGWHLADLPRPGIYKQPRAPETLPHFMEHGGVWVLYNCPDGCPDDVAQIESIVNGAIDRGRPAAAAPFPTMESKFAAVSWQWLQTWDTLNAEQIETFINRHTCQYNPEGPGYCAVAKGKIGSQTASTPLPVENVPFSVFGSATPTAGATGTPAAPTATPAAATATPTPAP